MIKKCVIDCAAVGFSQRHIVDVGFVGMIHSGSFPIGTSSYCMVLALT